MKKEKSIYELSLEEAVERLSEIGRVRAKAASFDEEADILSQRIMELRPEPEFMDLDQLKAEVMRLDGFHCDVIKPFYEHRQRVYDTLREITGPGFIWEGDEVINEGMGIHWQDERGLVWATEIKTGTFVEFQTFGVTRTRDLERGEVKGLSMTKARKFGYCVEGKGGNGTPAVIEENIPEV